MRNHLQVSQGNCYGGLSGHLRQLSKQVSKRSTNLGLDFVEDLVGDLAGDLAGDLVGRQSRFSTFDFARICKRGQFTSGKLNVGIAVSQLRNRIAYADLCA